MKNGESKAKSNDGVKRLGKRAAREVSIEAIHANIATLERLHDSAILSAVWPNGASPVKLSEAVALAGEEKRAAEYDQALHAAMAHREVVRCPILAVLGQLNAGKSSVVASFLSEAGRKRVPRGTENRFGTHRFVYWIPSRWMKDVTTKEAFLELLAVAHGKSIEFLSLDPLEAEEQYRSGRDDLKKMQIPLVAADETLDALGAAFLDCPDVQTKDRQTQKPDDANPRLDFIGSAARVCSAFLLVWDRSQLRDDLLSRFLETIRERMAGVPLHLLINMITPERGQPTLTRNDPDLVQRLGQFDIERDACYGAFNFRIGPQDGEPGWRDLTPAALVRHFDDMEHRLGKDGRFPLFFSLATEDDRNLPAAVESVRFLANLPSRLDAAQLQEQKLRDHWRELHGLGRANLHSVAMYVEQCTEDVKRVHAGLLEFCRGLLTDSNGEPLQSASEPFAKAFNESFIRTAPRAIKWVLDLHARGKRALRAAKKRFTELSFLKWMRKARDAKDSIKAGLQDLGIASGRLDDPESLAHDMRTCRWVPDNIGEEELARGWKQVLKRFRGHQDKAVNLDPRKLDEMAQAIWDSMTLGQQIRVAFKQAVDLFATILAFGGAVTALVDGGATLLASYSLAATVSGAIPGFVILQFAAAAAAGGAVWQFVCNAIECNTLPALSLLFALACDAFGVPRTVGNASGTVHFGRRKPSESVKRKTFRLSDADVPAEPPVCPLGSLRMWKKTPIFNEYQETFGNE